ncbi:MAG TPA: hypothetical protein VFE32_16735 [Puia sp.]|jgi:hypothetical protein|nr:hypothetical protein [Puia sp.]
MRWKRLCENDFFIWSVLIVSAVYLGFISLSIHEGIFYAGDQGIKSLVVKQITEGYGFKYLHLPQPDWVQSIWKAGFSPLRTPSFYNSPGGYIIVYPPAFQIVSAWLYEKWGTAGLYVIPMLSTVILISWFVILLKRCGVRPVWVAIGLFVLVFCSPLPLYGVMFWEHLPAVMLLFAGVSFIARPPRRAVSACILGVVSGLAVFLRPEALMMDLLYSVAVIGLHFRNRQIAPSIDVPPRSRSKAIWFLGGLLLPILAFFVFNHLEYGSILGIHSRQVFADNDPQTRMTLSHGLDNLWENNSISTQHFLFVLLLIPLAIRAIKTKGASDPRPLFLAGIVILFSFLTPWVLPNNGIVQWGARYFLPIIPPTLVALLIGERNWNLFERRRIPLWLSAFMVVFICYDFYHNTHGGGYKEVRWRYNQRLTKTYRLIDSQPGNVVIVSHYWMINDFAYLFDKDYFFAASSNDSLSRLLPLLKKNGVRKYIFVYDPQGPTLPTMLKDSTTSHWWVDRAHHVYVKDEYAAKVYPIL